MDLLPVEPIAKELELSEMDIMKNRCELVESQIKILQKMVDDTTNENKMLKDLVEKLYIIVLLFFNFSLVSITKCLISKYALKSFPLIKKSMCFRLSLGLVNKY